MWNPHCWCKEWDVEQLQGIFCQNEICSLNRLLTGVYEFSKCFLLEKKKKNIKIRNISKSAVLSILSVFMDARIYSDRGDWSGNSNKTMLPSWQPSASLQWHFHVSWGRLRIFLFPEMLLELSHGCWAGSTCGTWLVCIHGVIPLGNTAVEGSCCPVPGIFLGYSGSFLALTSHPIY